MKKILSSLLILTLLCPANVFAARIDSYSNINTLAVEDEFVIWDASATAVKNINWDDMEELYTDASIRTTDVTTNNATTSKHGFLKKLSNIATEFMDGTGNWSTPSGGGSINWDGIGNPAANKVFTMGTFTNAWTSTAVTDSFIFTTNAALPQGESLISLREGSGNPTAGSALLEFINTDGDVSDMKGDGKLVFEPNATGATTTQVDFRSSSSNLLLGNSAGELITTGTGNTVYGMSAGAMIGTGVIDTTGMGYRACGGIGAGMSGDYNTCMGYVAGQNLTTGHRNVILGMGAGSNISTGAYNTVLGVDTYKDDTGNRNFISGYHSAFALTSGDDNIIISGVGSGVTGSPTVDTITTANKLILIGMGAAPADSLTASGCLGNACVVSQNNRFVIGGVSTSRMDLIVTPPTVQTIASGGTITADACGTIKTIQSTGSQTTSTTNTFTDPTTVPTGCCMDVINIDAADTITLDVNTNFVTNAGLDQALSPSDALRVCTNGTTWFQMAPLSLN